MKTSLFVLLAFTSAVYAQQDVAPLDARQLLLELKEIQTKQETSANSSQKRNLDLVFRAAATKDSAIAFYEDAQMATQFQGANRENSQFRDWKKRQEDQLKNNDFRESVRLHLFYLALSLKKAADVKPEELAPQVADYLKVLDASDLALEVRDSLLRNSVADGIFAKWLGLGPELAKAKDWEMNPGRANEIAAKYLLPYWRNIKSPALLAYWDARIARSNEAAGDVKLDFQSKNYATIQRPELLWQRAQEYIVLDQPNRAVQEMFAIIKNYPTHPKAEEWIAALQKRLDPATSAPEISQ